MLAELHVRNYVLIDSLDIEFPEGLVIITGQTGAGKSIIMGALNMALGAKADASVIGSAADNCVVEAVFDADPDDEELRKTAEDNDAEWDGGHLLVRRVINRSGRSRSFLNDSPVSVHVLASVSSRLLDIHSQHQTLILSDRRFRLSVLDRYAGNGGLLQEYSGLWNRFNSVNSSISDLEERIARASAEQEYNRSVFSQLEEARLSEGELEELESEQKYLANAEEIKMHLCSAESLFSGEGSSEGQKPVSASLKDAERALEKVSSYMPQAASLVSRIESCRLELDDVFAEVSDMNSSAEASPERLQEVESRISLLYGLMHRHSCSNVHELIGLRDSLSMSINGISDMEDRLKDLRLESESLGHEIGILADRLHETRSAAAESLSAVIQERIRFMEMPYAVFRTDVERTALSVSGSDTAVFRFSASGQEPEDLSKCASGGELSRIMLALKEVMARFFRMPTMVFDEIDTGVSGSVADKMGRVICDMGRYMQVFAITHLPQVAAKGKAHYLVSKSVDPVTSTAVTTIKRLSEEQRVMELARMLSGSELTDAAIANAKELLQS